MSTVPRIHNRRCLVAVIVCLVAHVTCQSCSLTVDSTWPYPSKSFVWAVGVRNITLLATYDCLTNESLAVSVLDNELNSTSLLTTVVEPSSVVIHSYDAGAVNSSLGNNSILSPPEINATTRYVFSPFANLNTSTVRRFKIKVEIRNRSWSGDVHIDYCRVARIVEPLVFNESGARSCSSDCGYTAGVSKVGRQRVRCAADRVPDVGDCVEDYSVLAAFNGVTVPAGSDLTLQCDTNNTANSSKTIAINSSHNGQNLTCEQNGTTTRSVTMDVRFAPEQVNTGEIQKLRIGDAGFLSAKFRTNPPLTLGDVSVTHSGSPLTNFYMTVDGVEHAVFIHFEKVTTDDLGPYNITLKSSDKLCWEDSILEIDALEERSPAWVSAWSISAIIMACLLFIVLVIAIAWAIRYKMNGGGKDNSYERRSSPNVHVSVSPSPKKQEPHVETSFSQPIRDDRPPMPPPSRAPADRNTHLQAHSPGPRRNQYDPPPRPPAARPQQPDYGADQRRPSALPPRREVMPPPPSMAQQGAMSLARNTQPPRWDETPGRSMHPPLPDHGDRRYQQNMQHHNGGHGGMPGYRRDQYNGQYQDDQRGFTMPHQRRY